MQSILDVAKGQTVLNIDIDDVDEARKKSMTRGSETDLAPRNTITYSIV